MLPAFKALKEGLKVLPGIGEKSATRMAAEILRLPFDRAEQLVQGIGEARTRIGFCHDCHAYAEEERCPICQSSRRQSPLLCVVRQPLDVWTLEETGRFAGCYHVLGGVLSPVDGVGPDDLHLADLRKRLTEEPVEELLFALPATPEAEATAHVIMQGLPANKIRFTHLAYGIPVGGTLEYLDQRTLGFALDNRRKY